MHLRPYHAEDISALVDIQVQCDQTDPLACYMSRKTDVYPATYRHTCLRFLRMKLLEPGTVAFVVETDSIESSPAAGPGPFGAIIGWSVWMRHGSSAVARSWQKPGETVSCSIEAGLHSLQNRYLDLLDPTVDHDHISKILHIISKPLDQGPLQESWELDGMYVSPSWQRRGVGKMLLQWGLTQATEECVSIVCKSSSVGVPFYEHAGFRSIEEQVFDPYFDPGHKGYHSMVWDPEEKERNDLEDAEPGRCESGDV